MVSFYKWFNQPVEHIWDKVWGIILVLTTRSLVLEVLGYFSSNMYHTSELFAEINLLFSANLCSAMASLPSLHKLMLNKELLDSMEEMCHLSSPEEPPAVTRHWIQGYRDLSKQTINLELESRVPISLLPCASGWSWASPWPSVSLSPTGWRHERPGSQGQTASGSPPPLDPSSQSWVWPDAGDQRVRLRDRMGQQPLQVGQ